MWDDCGTATDGTKEIIDLFGLKVFSTPKPVSFIEKIIELGTTGNDIVLDFFSGSATTAHAVLQHNALQNTQCKYILIQVEEPIKEDSIEFASGYKTISDIGKRRIQLASERIKGETNADIDYGFRVFKLDDSNMTDVYYNPSEYSQDLLSALESNIKPDRTDLDLLFGCLLEWGLPLSLPYSSEEIDGFTVHDYNDGDLIACFDENVPDSVVKAIAKKQPLRAVFRDNSFSDSPSKINVGEIFKLLAPNTRVKVI